MILQCQIALPDGATEIAERVGKKFLEVDEDTVEALHAKNVGLAKVKDFLSEKL
jgi:hypothetical protein